MKTGIPVTLVAAAISWPAFGDDLRISNDPFAQPRSQIAYDWTGFFGGVTVGGAWGLSNAKTTVGCPANGYFCTSLLLQGNASQIGGIASGSRNSSGFTGGVEVGYNWQAGNFVYGVETDFGALHLKGATGGTAVYSIGAPANSFSVGTSFQTNWFATARGRLGWSFSNFMLYGAGGLALTDLKVSNFYSDNVVIGFLGGASGATESASQSAIAVGWTVGGGAEWALSRNWALKAEYLYADFGRRVSANGVITNPGGIFAGRSNPIGTSTSLIAQIARVGVDYRF